MSDPESGFSGIRAETGRALPPAVRVSGPPVVGQQGNLPAVWPTDQFKAKVSHDPNRWLAFHGSLYNRRALLRQLNLSETTTNAAVLLNALKRWPTSWIEHLDGIYALAYWASDDRGLTLRRDASGALGLIYARTANGGLAFSTHLGILVRLPGVS